MPVRCSTACSGKIYEQVKGSIYQLIGSLEMVVFMLLALPLLKGGELSLGAFFAYSFLREIFTSYTSKIFLPSCRKPTARYR